jgi:hypothetical protein
VASGETAHRNSATSRGKKAFMVTDGTDKVACEQGARIKGDASNDANEMTYVQGASAGRQPRRPAKTGAID